MYDHSEIAREILQQLLTSGARKGAWLKPMLVREFERRTGKAFRSAFWNYPKFSSFLVANADLVEVVPPEGPGDITVLLRHDHGAMKLGLPHAPAPVSDGPSSYLPPPLWHAFTNPDPKRKRFFHRFMHNVVHYIDGSPAEPNPRISAAVHADNNYIEITPADADQQNQWMREFVATVQIPHAKKQLVDSLLGVPFSSQLNTTFLAALGDLAEQWGRFRAQKVRQHVEQWASQRSLSLNELTAKAKGVEKPSSGTLLMALGSEGSTSEADLRRLVHIAIDTLSYGELGQVLLPASVLSKLTKHRVD
jgi:hypothetical protein